MSRLDLCVFAEGFLGGWETGVGIFSAFNYRDRSVEYLTESSSPIAVKWVLTKPTFMPVKLNGMNIWGKQTQKGCEHGWSKLFKKSEWKCAKTFWPISPALIK